MVELYLKKYIETVKKRLIVKLWAEEPGGLQSMGLQRVGHG